MKLILVSTVLLLAASLSSCGGGGGGDGGGGGGNNQLIAQANAFATSIASPAGRAALVSDVSTLLAGQDLLFLDQADQSFLVGTLGSGYFLLADRVPAELVTIWNKLAASPQHGAFFAALSAWAAQLPPGTIAATSFGQDGTSPEAAFTGVPAAPTPCAIATANQACAEVTTMLGTAGIPCTGIFCGAHPSWTSVVGCFASLFALAGCEFITAGTGTPGCILVARLISTAAAAVGIARSIDTVQSVCSQQAANIGIVGFSETGRCSPASSACHFGTPAVVASLQSSLQNALGPYGAVVLVTGGDPTSINGQVLYGSLVANVAFQSAVVIPSNQWNDWYLNFVQAVQQQFDAIISGYGTPPAALSLEACLTLASGGDPCFSVL